METALMERTPAIIAAEINTLKDQARRMALAYCIEIGRRLVEAKTLVAYGSWGDWLQANVDYSQSTAGNFIRLFEEYGPAGGLLGGEADLQTLGKLSYTQAVALLAVPAEERAAFLEENDVEGMSTRELQQAIRERDEARKQLEEARDDVVALRGDLGMREEQLEKKQKAIDQLSNDMAEASKEHRKVKELLQQAQDSHASDAEIKKLRDQLKDSEKKVETAQRQVRELSESLEKAEQEKAIEPAVVEVVPEETKLELEGLREKNKRLETKLGQSDAPAVKFTVHFDQLKEAFRLLLADITEMAGTGDIEKVERYKDALEKTINAMKERL